jgi:hypothetical protein
MTADPKIIVVLEENNLMANRLRTYWAERSGGKSDLLRRALADALIADMVVTITDPKAARTTELHTGGDPSHG